MTAEVDRLDQKDAAQDILITSNTQTITANKAASEAKDADQDSITASNKADADRKNVVTNDRITDETNRLDTVIATNNKTTNDRVTSEVSRLDEKDVSQDNTIAANKADADSKNTITNDRVTTEVGRLDDKNAAQDVVIADNRAEMFEQINITNNNMSAQFVKMETNQAITDAAQNDKIQSNSDKIDSLGYRVSENETMLSAGVASAIALSQMPTPVHAGKSMVTVGSGYFNNQSALAVGLTGSTDDGKISYKFGTSWSKEGGTSFGAGAGYSWN